MQSLIRQNPVHIVRDFKQISVLTFIIISKGNRPQFFMSNNSAISFLPFVKAPIGKSWVALPLPYSEQS
jgi:hypothetical protein